MLEHCCHKGTPGIALELLRNVTATETALMEKMKKDVAHFVLMEDSGAGLLGPSIGSLSANVPHHVTSVMVLVIALIFLMSLHAPVGQTSFDVLQEQMYATATIAFLRIIDVIEIETAATTVMNKTVCTRVLLAGLCVRLA